MRRLLLLALALVALAAVPAQAAATVKVYYLQGEQAVAFNRKGTTLDEALAALLAGPTAAEAKKNVRTYLVPGTALRAAPTVVNGTATVDFTALLADGYDGDELGARLTQVVLTVAGTPGVKRVQVLVEGGVPLGLFPGFDVSGPITPAQLRAPDGPPPKPPVDEGGSATDSTRQLQQQLADLGYLPANAVDGVAGEQTRHAVVAFQKWQGLSRDGVVGPATRSALAKAKRPTPRLSSAGRRIEVLLDRQLVLTIVGSRVERIIDVSTGAAATATPPGRYSIYRKELKSWSVPFSVWLPYASYFVGGIAFHEYPDVPPYAASHGCVRTPSSDAPYLYSFATMGMPVAVLTSS